MTTSRHELHAAQIAVAFERRLDQIEIEIEVDAASYFMTDLERSSLLAQIARRRRVIRGEEFEIQR